MVDWGTTLGGDTGGYTTSVTGSGGCLVGVVGVIASQNISVNFVRATNFGFDNFAQVTGGAEILSLLDNYLLI